MNIEITVLWPVRKSVICNDYTWTDILVAIGFCKSRREAKQKIKEGALRIYS